MAKVDAMSSAERQADIQKALDAGYTQEQIDRYLATGQNVAQPTPKKKTPKEIESERKSNEKCKRNICATEAGKAGTEYAAKQIIYSKS